jgi:hypothetical protein
MGFLNGKLVVTAVAAAGLASPALAIDAIGLNYVNNDDPGVQNGAGDALLAAESAGATGFAQANWNNLGRWGATVSLNDNTGAGTLVTTTWDSNNSWNNGAGTSTPDRKLMNGYLDATGQPNDNVTSPYPFFDNKNKPEVFIKGLSSWLAGKGASTYSVVVYTDGDNAEGRVGEYWLQGAGSGDPPGSLTADLTPHVFKGDLDNFSGVYTPIPTVGTTALAPGLGNYMVFTGLSADTFVLRTEEISGTVNDPTTFRAQINAVQIIAEVPEPTSLAFLGIGMMGLLVRRRHQSRWS